MHDAHSFADPQSARVTHLKLDLQVDFSERILTGTASFDLQLAAGCAQVVFDTRKLQLQRITDVGGNSLDYVLAPEDPVLGAKLTVQLPADVQRVVIHYTTSPEAEALQWLTAEQTASGEAPFLFTQGHAIRSGNAGKSKHCTRRGALRSLRIRTCCTTRSQAFDIGA